MVAAQGALNQAQQIPVSLRAAIAASSLLSRSQPDGSCALLSPPKYILLWVGRELFLFVEEGGDGFLFLLENAPDIGGDTGILGRPNDAQRHASRFF